MRNRAALLASLLTICTAVRPCESQGRAQRQHPDTLRNEGVIRLVAAQLPTDVIIAKIDASIDQFDVSTGGLIELNHAKVPPLVVKAMISRMSREASSTDYQPNSAEPGDAAISQPGIPQRPGIYVASGETNAQLIAIESSAFSQTKTGGYLESALSYGTSKSETRAIVHGLHAATAVQRRPMFLIVFGSAGSLNASGSGLTALSSPKQLQLIRLHQIAPGNREAVVSTSSGGDVSTGFSGSDVVSFAATKLREGVYRLSLASPLQSGEYGFIPAGAGVPTQIWDFFVP